MDKQEQEKIEKLFKKLQESLGYTDEELAIFRSRPQYAKAMTSSPMFHTHNIIAECVESHNCNGGHKVGDRIVMDARGVLLKDQCPDAICVFAIQAFAPYIYGIWERFYQDVDGPCLLDMVHCTDVGVRKGGWGEAIWRVYSEPKKKRE